MSRAGQIASVIRMAQRIDRSRYPGPAGEDRRLYTPWMPYSIPAFLGLLLEALPETPPGYRFLEIGCGPGTKMLLARDIAGLDVHGIERDDEAASAARSLGLPAETADAAEWKGYGDYDLIWFNRPVRDLALQAALEQRVWDEMSPGAVVMCANLEHPPPSSWLTVLDDWEMRRGIWAKPPPAA